MRNQPLTGYMLHQKPYQDNRSLSYFFSEEFGLIHGIGKKNLPLFMPLSLLATGKSALKTFSQSQITNHHSPLHGQALFAGLYLNELLLKLLPVEEPMPSVWQHYERCIWQIHSIYQDSELEHPESAFTLLKWYLRQFETSLLDNLGYGIDFLHDSIGEVIIANQYYEYRLQQGFVPIFITNLVQQSTIFLGQDIIDWQHSLKNTAIFPPPAQQIVNQFSIVYRRVIDDLINYEVLQSRELWRQFMQFT